MKKLTLLLAAATIANSALASDLSLRATRKAAENAEYSDKEWEQVLENPESIVDHIQLVALETLDIAMKEQDHAAATLSELTPFLKEHDKVNRIFLNAGEYYIIKGAFISADKYILHKITPQSYLWLRELINANDRYYAAERALKDFEKRVDYAMRYPSRIGNGVLLASNTTQRIDDLKKALDYTSDWRKSVIRRQPNFFYRTLARARNLTVGTLAIATVTVGAAAVADSGTYVLVPEESMKTFKKNIDTKIRLLRKRLGYK